MEDWQAFVFMLTGITILFALYIYNPPSPILPIAFFFAVVLLLFPHSVAAYAIIEKKQKEAEKE